MTAFAKTGTTTDYKDRYFVGGTPYHVAALWYGYDKTKVLSSSDYNHMYAWKTVMDKVDKALKLENKSFPNCSAVEVRWYCTGTGKLATTGCGSKARGYYASWNLPGKCTHGGTLLGKISGGSGNSIIGSTKSLSISTSRDADDDDEDEDDEKTTDKDKKEKTSGDEEDSTKGEKTSEKSTKPKKTTEKPTKPKPTKPEPTKTEPTSPPEPVTDPPEPPEPEGE
jgi:membrane peptidoglycan carboxypeptidase